MLSAQPENLIVTDPFVYFFKAYRNFHMTRHATSGWDPDEPTSDHFRSPLPEVDRAILEADLSEEMPKALRTSMIADIRAWKHHQHPHLCERLDELQPGSFAAVYRRLVELCVELYGSQATEVAGTKLSWCEEYLPALGRAFPRMHFVLLVRDLRSIVASQESQLGRGIGKRPLLFYVRHWRKSVAFARTFAEYDVALRERTHLVRYEDLVRAPRETLERLCARGPLRFHEAMLQPSMYRGASETGKWTPNSSFSGGEGIYPDSIDRWRGVLTRDQVRSIEALAGPELAWMGYGFTEPPSSPGELMELDCEPPLNELADWIRDFPCCDYLRDAEARRRELEVEERRHRVVEAGRLTNEDLELFPAPEGFAALSEAWRNDVRVQVRA